MGREDKKEPFLINLGRATMRGLRKCQKCGTMNGTRGYSCKNKSCDVVFKEVGNKKKISSEPCKINTGSSAQIYSVRVRDKGPDYRGFVQLPNEDPLEDAFLEAELIMEAGAKCFVESCIRSNRFYNTSLKALEPCSHIRSAMVCLKDSQPLHLKNSVLNMLPIPVEYKEEMFHLATETMGPLVQRVSKNLIVVKCKPDNLHPLGFLHFNFNLSKGRSGGDLKFFCSCRNFKFQCSSKGTSYKKCVHLYACIVAFASNEKLAEEFSSYIDLIQSKSPPKRGIGNKDESEERNLDSDEGDLTAIHELEDSSKDLDESSFLILNDTETGAQVEVEVVRDDAQLLDLPISTAHQVNLEDKLELQLRTEDGIHLQTSDGGTISVHQLPENISLSSLRCKQDESIVRASSALLSLQKSANKKKADSGVSKKQIADKKQGEDVEELSLPYSSWLSSVTERINQSMHYGFSGKPEPLVFHLPKNFFECFIERVNRICSSGSKKRKISPELQKFARKDAVPLGEFTKYTWKLFSLKQVMEIFDNPEVSLEVTRYFYQQKDGSFKCCPCPKGAEEDVKTASSTSQHIRPREYKTCLRVGESGSSLFAKDPTPFTIEWIPNILPISEIGELRLKFEFDNYYNKQLVAGLGGGKQILMAPAIKKSPGPPLLAPRPTLNKLNENFYSISSEGLGESITLLTF